MGRPHIPVFKPKTYQPAPELTAGGRSHHRLVVVGSGPIGLATALSLARYGHQVLLLTAFDFIAAGSKAICFSKQSLDIFDRLGMGDRALDKGVVWNVGKVFWGDRPDPIYEFDMLPVKDQKNPGFINIQQYYIEDYLCDKVEAHPDIELRWGHEVTGLETRDDGVTLAVHTRDGDYRVKADYLLACDGSRSPIRHAMGLDFQGRIFEDHFLIADVKFQQERPSERWFWFDPPFNPGQTALLHKQPDDVWRLDFQLGWDIDKAEAVKSKNVAHYVKGMLGNDVVYEDEWLSIYTFQCRRMARFVHGRVLFVGDSAHLVSPFGARGCNGGLSDVDNVSWKLDRVLRGTSPETLLETYNDERVAGSDENILNSSRSTDFMTPKDDNSRALRDAVLELAGDFEFARPFVNSGRLSVPTPYHGSPLSTPDRDVWTGGVAPGHAAVDAPLDPPDQPWLLRELGDRFTVLHFGELPPDSKQECITLPADSLAAQRYGAEQGATYLVRPDQVVAARWKSAAAGDIEAAWHRATGRSG